MRKITTLLAAGLCLLGLQPVKADHLADRLTFSARLQPAPGVTSNGNGVAAFMLNSTMDTLYYTISTASLSSAINGFHIHNARTGGNVIIDYNGKVLGNTVRTFLTGNDLKTYLPDFIAGNLYVAVHTVNNPAVEIFGFVKLESDWGFFAQLDGTQAGSGSSAMGWAAVNFGLKGDTAVVRVATTGLMGGITMAHLHWGKAGQNGGVALGLDNAITADSMALVGGVSIAPAAWTDLMAALMNDSIYLNLHTSANGGGEIRGQVRTTPTLRFDGWLNQAAITAGGGTVAVPSMGYGVTTLSLNASFDTLRYEILFNNLTSNVSMAHFHNAEPTMSGGVVKTIMVTGNTVSGIWTKNDAEPLSPMMVSELLKGNIYIVLHTDSNPGGELRGNITRLAREGFIAELDPQQAGVSSTGRGTGVVSFDRDRTNLHYMFAFDNLSSAVTMAHLHKGIKGESGGVEYDLGLPTNGGFYNYWTAANGFNNARTLPLRRGDSIYVNIHTNTFGGGEIRGQLMRYYRISSETMDTTSTGILESEIAAANYVMYPNPAAEQLFINGNNLNGTIEVRVSDLSGKAVLNLNSPLNEPIQISNLDRGIYLVEVLQNGQSLGVSRLLKQ